MSCYEADTAPRTLRAAIDNPRTISMTDEKRGGPPSRGGPGGGNREGRPGGGRRDDRRGGPRKGGFGKGPAKPERRETYESLQQLTRGEGFRIDKFVLAEKVTHK